MNTDAVLSDIQKISDASGQDFLELSAHFPVLIEELSDTDRAAGKSRKIDSLAEIRTALTQSITSQNKTLESDRTFLGSFHQKNTDLFTRFSEKMDFLSQMNDLVLKIKDESMEMEIISLNAMTVSIKSGREGQAFSYITANLKRLSLQLITQSDRLIAFENAVQKNIAELKSTIETVSKIWGNAGKFNTNSFSTIISVIDDITSEINDITKQAVMVKKPIIRAMETIQIQDIIRQSLDDVKMTVKKMHVSDEYESDETKLDQLTFNCKLAELAADILSHIQLKLDDSIALFRQNSSEVKGILEDVEARKTSLIGKYLNTGTEDCHNLKNLISSSIDELAEFMNQIRSYQREQGKVLGKAVSIQDEVVNMQAHFDEFFPIINNLQYVAIAQRIEVARNTAIESIRSTVEHMSDLIVQTNGNVVSAQEHLQNFTDSSNTLIKKFSSETATDKNKFTEIKTNKQVFLQTLQELQEQFSDAILNFTVYSDDFINSYQTIEACIDRLEGLSEGLQNTAGAVNVIKA